jgi:hypothetical protein
MPIQPAQQKTKFLSTLLDYTEGQSGGIRLFVIPPQSPKLQGYVERSNRTHREEFYEVEEIAILLEDHNQHKPSRH